MLTKLSHGKYHRYNKLDNDSRHKPTRAGNLPIRKIQLPRLHVTYISYLFRAKIHVAGHNHFWYPRMTSWVQKTIRKKEVH
jgi:hypothetical protein